MNLKLQIYGLIILAFIAGLFRWKAKAVNDALENQIVKARERDQEKADAVRDRVRDVERVRDDEIEYRD